MADQEKINKLNLYISLVREGCMRSPYNYGAQVDLGTILTLAEELGLRVPRPQDPEGLLLHEANQLMKRLVL